MTWSLLFLRAHCIAVGLLLATPGFAAARDLLATDSWPMADIQQTLSDEIGGALVHDITIGTDRISLTADHPTDPEQTTDYSWDGQDIWRGISMPNFAALGMGDAAAFPLADLPFERLPEVKAAAIAAYGLPGAQITEIEGTMPTTRTSKKLIPLWEVHFAQGNGETGSVFLTANAQVVDVLLPASQVEVTASGPWLAPETVANTLARLGEEFGIDARFVEILIDDSQARVSLEDPQQPGAIAEFTMDAQSITRQSSMIASPFAPTLDRSFTIADISALDPARLTDLEARTLERMGMPGMAIFRYTISRNTLFMTPEDDRLLVEIRAEMPDQWTGGRVAYDMAGNEVDVVTP